jgi:arginine exporter protein ArgO
MLRKLFCNGIIWCAILCFAGCAFLAAYTSLTANKENQNSESQTKNQMVMKMEETIFACNMAALRTKEKARYDVLIKQLRNWRTVLFFTILQIPKTLQTLLNSSPTNGSAARS